MASFEISGNAISVRSFDDRIVDWSYANGRGYGALYTLDPASGSVAWLTEGDSWSDSYPTWAPDGRSAVFISTRSGHMEVWSIDVVSRALRQVTRTPRGTLLEWPRWSPDGTRLAVIRIGDQHRLEIYALGIPNIGRQATNAVFSR